MLTLDWRIRSDCMIYGIPIVGFAIATWEIARAQARYSTCHSAGWTCGAEYEATWIAFDHLNVAFVSTIAPLVFCLIVLEVVRRFR